MVETYVAWNLHEPYEGVFNFNNDKHSNLDIAKFIEMAHEIGLMVNLRPGPYICAEWEWGGHPYWLLYDSTMKVRTTHSGYLTAVRRFYVELFNQVEHLMYSEGGPIVMVQVENEYAGYADYVGDESSHDPLYLAWLRDLIRDLGVDELLFTCDGGWDLPKYLNPELGLALDDVLWTVNFKDKANIYLKALAEIQPGKPVMVMEWWTGWFDYWGINHQTWDNDLFESELHAILNYGSTGGSVNYYMFHGGTNFGFMNGANWNVGAETGRFEYQPVTTSYDYDAPLSEHGNMTEKCKITQDAVRDIVGYPIPDVEIPTSPVTTDHDELFAAEAATFWRNLQVENVKASSPIPMELLDVNQGRGQAYGYNLYSASKLIDAGDHTINDIDQALTGRATIYVDKREEYRITNSPGNQEIDPVINVTATNDQSQVEILVENSGRINYKTLDNQYMGLNKPVGIDGNTDFEWTIYSLPMEEDYISSLKYDPNDARVIQAPAFYKFNLEISPTGLFDTFINMGHWGKGVVWANGINLGRYWNLGPAHTMYLPAPFLKSGSNEIVVFEEIQAPQNRNLIFQNSPMLECRPNCGSAGLP